MSDNKEEKIVGTWQIVPIDLGVNRHWIFSDDNKLSLYNENDTNFIEGTYNIELKQTRYYLNIDSLGYQNGKYLILKHNKDILIIQRIQADYPGAFLRREFVKL